MTPKANKTAKAPKDPAYICPVMPIFHNPALKGMINAQEHKSKKMNLLIVGGRPKGLAKA